MKINNPFSKQNILAVFPVVLVMVLDGIFTLAGQPDSYWQDYSSFNEGSPLGQILMLNPVHFVAFFIFYLLIVLFLIVNIKRPFNIIVAMGFFLGHSWGSATWVRTIIYNLTGTQADYWYSVVGYFIVVAIISGFFINLSLKNNKI
jgi:hypothetical protein